MEFLHQQRSSTVATYGPDGQIHLVGMRDAVKDNTVRIETKRKSQKVVNLRRDPRMSFLVEAGETYDQLRGVAMEGRGVVIEDAGCGLGRLRGHLQPLQRRRTPRR